MNINRIYFFILVIIISIGGIFRFYNLSSVPPSLNWDEVAMGYNAYSILETGKDEYGDLLPKYFRSLDDYKRPVYPYILVPSVAIFGLTDFAVRFPAAFFGTFTILIVYLLTQELFKKRSISLLTSLTLAILPWHIQFSRAAYESTIGLFLTVTGVLTMLWGVKYNRWWLPFSAILFGLSIYSYLGQRGVVPILVVSLFVIYWKELFNKKLINRFSKLPIYLFVGITVLFWASLALDMTGPEGTIRYKATNIFENNEIIKQNFEEIQYDGTLGINIPRRIIHHDLLIGVELIARGYLVHFSPDFFFFDLGQQHHHAPRMGIVYLWMLPFLLYGVYYLIQKYKYKEKWILFIWLLATPIAASVTFQIPHALRVAEMIVPISIIIGCGIYGIFTILKSFNKHLMMVTGVGLFIIACFFIFEYSHQYFIHLPYERARDWVYGRREMVEFVESRKNQYDSVVASTSLEWPYIYFLYYTQYDPALYQKQGGTKSGSWEEEGNAYDMYEFHKFDYLKEQDGKTLFIGKPSEFPESVKPLKIVEYPNGEDVLYIVE